MTLLVRWAYALLLALLTPAYLFRLLWRARVEPLYAHALSERFGFYANHHPRGVWVWVHAVSLGETRAAAALVDALRVKAPGMRLLLTHGTATGRKAGQALLRAGDAQVWLPYDTPYAVKRFLKHFEPMVGVLIETEVWPQLLHQAHRHGLPIFLVNGRLSERSLRRGRRFAALMRPAAQQLRLVMAQTDADALRFKQAGVRDVVVYGNLKFDMQPEEGQLVLGRRWREKVGRLVVLAASTRKGEEGPLLLAWKAQVASLSIQPLLVIVPRHPQRFDEVASLIESTGFRSSRRSMWTDTPSPESLVADVWLGDSMGEMALYYSMAHLALLGGSFAPLGGQNLIEAAACDCPVVMGPHTFNFAQASEMAVQAGAAWRDVDLEAAIGHGLALLVSGELVAASGQARRFFLTHRGAAEAMAQQVLGVLASPR